MPHSSDNLNSSNDSLNNDFSSEADTLDSDFSDGDTLDSRSEEDIYDIAEAGPSDEVPINSRSGSTERKKLDRDNVYDEAEAGSCYEVPINNGSDNTEVINAVESNDDVYESLPWQIDDETHPEAGASGQPQGVAAAVSKSRSSSGGSYGETDANTPAKAPQKPPRKKSKENNSKQQLQTCSEYMPPNNLNAGASAQVATAVSKNRSNSDGSEKKSIFKKAKAKIGKVGRRLSAGSDPKKIRKSDATEQRERAHSTSPSHVSRESSASNSSDTQVPVFGDSADGLYTEPADSIADNSNKDRDQHYDAVADEQHSAIPEYAQVDKSNKKVRTVPVDTIKEKKDQSTQTDKQQRTRQPGLVEIATTTVDGLQKSDTIVKMIANLIEKSDDENLKAFLKSDEVITFKSLLCSCIEHCEVFLNLVNMIEQSKDQKIQKATSVYGFFNQRNHEKVSNEMDSLSTVKEAEKPHVPQRVNNAPPLVKRETKPKLST